MKAPTHKIAKHLLRILKKYLKLNNH